MVNFANHNDDVKKQIYEIYLQVFNLPFSVQKKNSIVSILMGGSPVSWRVVGITEAALNLLSENDYKYLAGAICRAHIIGRYRTAQIIFECESPVSLEKLFRIVWENDKTVIALKRENSRNFELPPYIPIDSELGLFPCGAVVGFRHSRAEIAFLRELHSRFRNKEIDLVKPDFEICGLE